MTESDVEKLMSPTISEAEKELICQTKFGKSFFESKDELEYEWFIHEISAKRWLITHMLLNMYPGFELTVQVYDYSRENYAVQPMWRYTEIDHQDLSFTFKSNVLDNRIIEHIEQTLCGQPYGLNHDSNTDFLHKIKQLIANKGKIKHGRKKENLRRIEKHRQNQETEKN